MTDKTVKVEFHQQSNKTVATVKVEVTGNIDDVNNLDVLDEAKALFNNASAYSYTKSSR